MTTERCDVVVIGAGFGGLYAVHKFRDQMGLTVKGFDAAGGVGGTWWWNRYPGARCDIPSVHYAYSFSDDIQRNWHWSEKYAGQPEILAYLEYVADRLDLTHAFTFNTRVTSSVWDDGVQRWLISTSDGCQVSARFVIAAGGNLSIPKNTVEFPGLEDFAGEVYFTSRWPHENVDFSGKRVGVIGTGSTGVQVVQEAGKTAGALSVFQRTPNYATPLRNEPIDPDQQRWLAENHAQVRAGSRDTISGVPLGQPWPSSHLVTADERRARYDELYSRGGFALLSAGFADILFDQEANDMLADYVREQIRARVHDPAVADALCPTTYPFGTKRPPLETKYYETFNQDNVELVRLDLEPIERITEHGIRTSGREIELDVLIMAIGFDAGTGAIRGLGLEGRSGVRLDDLWREAPRNYLGIAMAGLPNLFTITGPTSAVALYNNPLAVEDHVDFAGAAIAHLLDNGGRTIEATNESQTRWYGIASGLLEQSLFPKAKSWYLGDNIPGKPRATGIFVGTAPLYRSFCAEVIATGFGGFAVDNEPVPIPPLMKLDPSAAALLDWLINQPTKPAEEPTIDEVRWAVGILALLGPDRQELIVTERTYPGPGGELPVRIYQPDRAQTDPRPVLVYFHGGGFIAGSVDAVDTTLRALANDLGALVVAPTYRVAPENPFPAAADDAFAAVQWTAQVASEFGGSPALLVVAGEGAGGNLASVTAVRCRDEGGPELAGQILLTPVIDGEADTDSMREFANAPLLTTAAATAMWSAYIGDPVNAESPRACANRATTHVGLPPTLIVTAECDPLRDDGENYAAQLRAAGVEVTAHRLDGLVHATFSLSRIIPRAHEITDLITDHLALVTTKSAAASLIS